MLRNVIKRSKTINKLNNTKIKKLLSKAKETTKKRFKKLDRLVSKLTLY